jgi:hypothetical protein
MARELPATRHKSLRTFCENARDSRELYEPPVLTTQERLLWHAGFHEAMSRVIEYIDSGSPPARSGAKRHPT